jgi:HEAT repeat protein
LKDHLWKVRYAACKALGKFGPKAASCLQDLLKVFIQGTVLRSQVAIAIASLGQEGEQALIDILVHHASGYGMQVRAAAAIGLGSVDPKTIPTSRIDTIAEKLFDVSNDARPVLRCAVLKALGALGRKGQEDFTYLKSASLLAFFYTFLKVRNTIQDGDCIGDSIALL